jgi:hypothetical protein
MSSRKRKQRERIAPPVRDDAHACTGEDDPKIDEFKPDYAAACVCCGQSPCVTGLRDGKVVYAGRACGVCLWGESELVDPAQW